MASVFDNADRRGVLLGSSSASTQATSVFPYHKHGAILCTTRLREMATALAGSEVIEIQEMQPDVAWTLLFESQIDKQPLP